MKISDIRILKHRYGKLLESGFPVDFELAAILTNDIAARGEVDILGNAVYKCTFASLGRKLNKDSRTIKRKLAELCASKFLQIRNNNSTLYVFVSLTEDCEKTKEKKTNDEKKQRKEKEAKRKENKEKKKNKEKSVRKEIFSRKNIPHTHTKHFESSEDIEKRKLRLMEEVRPFVEFYGRDFCNEFFAYWTELDAEGKLMRFELEKAWKTETRLKKWKKTEWESKKGFKGQKADTNAIQDRTKEIIEHERERDLKELESCPRDIFLIYQRYNETDLQNITSDDVECFFASKPWQGIDDERSLVNGWIEHRRHLRERYKIKYRPPN